MHNEFMAIIERDGEWFIARESLAQAASLILDDRREDRLRNT